MKGTSAQRLLVLRYLNSKLGILYYLLKANLKGNWVKLYDMGGTFREAWKGLKENPF